jgi:hypothetical protein
MLKGMVSLIIPCDSDLLYLIGMFNRLPFLIPVAFMFTFSHGSIAQTVVESKELDGIENVEGIDLIKIRSAKDLKPYLVDKNRGYTVQDEGTEFIDHDVKYVTRAALDVDMPDRAILSYTDAVLRGDTLDILIHEFDESHNHDFQIRLVGGKHAMLYDYSYPVDEVNRKITTMSSKLILNSGVFKKGATIRGYLEYSGKCVQACEDQKAPIVVKGNFAVVIR